MPICQEIGSHRERRLLNIRLGIPQVLVLDSAFTSALQIGVLRNQLVTLTNMATKKTQDAHVVSTLMEQAGRFETMSVYLARSPGLAIRQASQIAEWGLKLTSAVNKIQMEAQAQAAEFQESLQNKIQDLETKANATKRKIQDADELGSPRTINANFRLIFGPAKTAAEYCSNSKKCAMITTAERIKTIRGLCEHHPDGIIMFSTSYSSKIWTESSPGVFDGIMKLVQKEKEQDWPDEIVDIMNKLEAERPMTSEFKSLRAKISQRQRRRRARVDNACPPIPGGGSTAQGHPIGGAAGATTSQSKPTQSPSKERREVKYMYTHALASNISKLPEPFRTAVENSRLWKWERGQNLNATGCLATLFPRDNTQDHYLVRK
ncbi:hypothetical protein ACJ73_01665 [Blastomyces percursus]|uniref:Uncharacterized protein n=1 Tax=Blastomyces percursus TaxID=1658174 RepID=A0A1J9RED1_9EURO|nr:hypothetical protein ACJ73_01665 [Blastomyces percursus]